MQQTKKDIAIAAIAGFITAILAFSVVKNAKLNSLLYIALPVGLPVLWAIGILFGKFLAKWLSIMYQFAKFVVVGFLNTMIDFSVFNLISFLTGITSGLMLGSINIPGFIMAAINSYFWNKFWVFSVQGGSASGGKKDYSDFITFAAVTIIGSLINSGIVAGLTAYVDPLFSMSPEKWMNIAKVLATVISLVFNFVGYKFIVFGKAKMLAGKVQA